MSYRNDGRARIPADIDREDTIIGRLTARQVLIFGAAAVLLWAAFMALRTVIPLWLLGAAALPVAGIAAALALGGRDGLPLDKFTAAAIRHLTAPRRLVTATEGVHPIPEWIDAPAQPLPAPLKLPATAITDDGVLHLASDGAAVIIECATVNFALRTPAEQDALIAGFARLLNSLTAPVQILVRAIPADLAPAIARLRDAAPALPHPALEQAALDHAAFLDDLAAERDLLTRQVLVVVREPAAARGDDPASIAARARRRADETLRGLAALGIPATVLDGPAVTSVLSAQVSS